MSGEAQDSDNNRSRSLFRQVRDTIGNMNRSRHRNDDRNGSPPSSSILTNNKRASFDSITTSTKVHSKKSTTPISFSQHLSLLNQVKSHINKTRKTHQTTPAEINGSKYLSLPPMNSFTVSL